MKLTGKCLDAFLKWSKTQTKLVIGIKRPIGGELIHLYSNVEILPETLLNALIIEFFDSVGIWNRAFFEVYENGIGNYFESQIQAIEKANEIFNLNNK